MTYPDSGQPQAPQAPEQYAAQPAAGAEDPGKTLGIVGLVLAFVFALAGLIVSIVARNKSKQAGFKNPFATWGIILSIAFMVIGTIVGVLLGVATFAAVNSEMAELTSQVCDTMGPGQHTIQGETFDCN